MSLKAAIKAPVSLASPISSGHTMPMSAPDGVNVEQQNSSEGSDHTLGKDSQSAGDHPNNSDGDATASGGPVASPGAVATTNGPNGSAPIKKEKSSPSSPPAGSKEGKGKHAPAPKNVAASQPEEKKTSFMDKFPDWFRLAIKTPRTWKNFFRCMVATLAAMITMIVQDSLDVLGAAGFFGLIMSQMLPPSMALSVYIFAFLTLAVGMCVGWAWGCAAMAAAIQARSQVLLASEIETERATYTQNTNLDAQYTASIFRGAFLDPRSSAVYGAFFFLGAYTLGFARAKYPRLMIGCIFGTIILDLMCSYGPLFPVVRYTLASNLLLPASVFLAIAVICTILIFPQSLHSIVLGLNNHACLSVLKNMLDLQTQVLDALPSDQDTWSGLAAKMGGLRTAHVMGVTGVTGQLKLLGLEITHGRFGAADLKRIVERGKVLGSRAYGLGSFVMTVDERQSAMNRLDDPPGPGQHPSVRRKRVMEESKAKRHPGTSLDDLVPLARDASADLRKAASEALGEGIRWLEETNHSRWKRPKSSPGIEVRKDNIATLKAALQEYKGDKRHAVLAPFANAFDAKGRIRHEVIGHYRYSARDLFTMFLLTNSLIYFSTDLIGFLELLLEIEEANPRNSWHFPREVAKTVKDTAGENAGNPLELGRHDDGSQSTLVDDETEAEEKQKEDKKKKSPRQWSKDPDALDPRNGVQRFGRTLHRIWAGISGVNGIFALKYAIVSLALWIPAVAPSSAQFVYENRGLWALIMAQTGMGVFTGEQIASFALRFLGTCLGLILGMVAWYIGAQRGSGNPYGVVIITMAVIAVPLFIRITAPMQSPPMVISLMTGVTTMFTIGYSWVDEHIYQTANQGSGAGLAGRRALLVIIGFTAAFIVMLFPKPTSARLIVRKTLARNISDVAELYGAIISGVEGETELEDGDAAAGAKSQALIEKGREERQEKYRARFTKIMARMGQLSAQMKFAGLEPGLKGPWPKEAYTELLSLEVQLISALAVLAGSYMRLEVKWTKRLALQSDMMHPAFIADILVLFSLLHQSLSNAQPLPPTMPIFERLGYHSLHKESDRFGATFSSQAIVKERRTFRAGSLSQASRPRASSLTQRSGTIGASSVSGEKNGKPGLAEVREEGDDGEPGKEGRIAEEEERVVLGLEGEMTLDLMKDEQFAIFATANVALIHTASCLNEIHRVVASLVGERELEGFDRTQERWARLELGETAV